MLIQDGTVFSLLTYFHLCYEPSKSYYWLDSMTGRNGEQLSFPTTTADNWSQTTHKQCLMWKTAGTKGKKRLHQTGVMG